MKQCAADLLTFLHTASYLFSSENALEENGYSENGHGKQTGLRLPVELSVSCSSNDVMYMAQSLYRPNSCTYATNI